MMRKSSAGLFYIVNKWAAMTFCGLFLLGVFLAVWGAGNFIKAAAQPEKKPIYSVATDKSEISLGINCAWDNSDIPELLKILEHYNIKASFFVLGEWCDQYPESVRQIAAAGHEIGSHSNSHANLTRLDEDGVIREIRESVRKIKDLTGKAPTLFRPPSGAYNTQVIDLIEKEGLYPIQWDCDSLDYRNPTPDEMQARILNKLRGGSITLFHSGAKNTPSALPQIIEAIRAEGYSFVTVSELIYKKPYTVDFEGRQRQLTVDS